jgi:hypothetical protein
MEHENISLFAKLIEQYGLLKVTASMLFAGLAISFPIAISWLKDLTRRKDEKRLFSILTELGEDIRTIASQYSDSLSKQMVEVLLESIYKKEFWALYDFIRDVIEKNDVENDRFGIEDRIKMQTKIAFKSISNDLMKFKYKSRCLADFLACGTWEAEISEVLIKAVFEAKKITVYKKIENMKSYLSVEFGNIHYFTMQNINKF